MEHRRTALADYACNTGEGPLWHPDQDSVWWTDIPAGKLFRYDCTTGEHHPVEIGRPVGGFTIQEDGRLLLFLDRGTIVLRNHDGTLETVLDEIPDETSTRFNDVSPDPEGRVFCGTMPTAERPGRLYRLDTDGSLHRVLDGIGCSNGIGFTPDLTRMYYTDSFAYTIWIFDYDRATGTISNQRVFAKAEEGGGFPDGMTVDSEGNVWSARWDGSCLVRYNPDGVETGRIPFPVLKVSSVVFGDADCAGMYVTTAGGDSKETDGPEAGTLYRVQVPGVHGVPEFRSRIRTAG
jgi:sugar lactone lactonase YvrE